MKAPLKLHLLLLALLGPPVCAQAQGTAFSYQGRLNQNDIPTTGIFDLRFMVYDAPLAPTPAGGPITIPAVPVTNGLFTVTLDFGAGLFTGAQRWLEIAVRTNGAVTFVALEPRQLVTSVPYATHANTASNVVNGSVVKSLNNLRDNVTLAAGANVTLTPSGNTLTIAAPGGVVGGPWSLNGSSAFYNAGNVGIGTSTPANKLTVLTPTLGYGVEHTDGDVRVSTFVGRGSGWLGTLSNHKLTFFANDNGFPHMTATLDTTGNLGIGTTTPASKLTVFSPSSLFTANYGVEHTDGTVRLSTFLDGSSGWLGTISPHPLKFYVANGGASMTIDPAGYVGIGTTSPQAKLHLYDSSLNSVAHRIETGAGVNAFARTEYANANGQWNVGTSRGFNGDQFYVHRQGSPSIALGIQPNGDAFLQGTMNCRVLTITGGADIAEPFQMSSDEIPKGAVVVIDEANPGHLKMSAEAYDKRVAGIVSGANGIKPGISLHQEGALEGGENVALSGRVYVQADAANGAIKPGDLLTTSGTPGHAMKVGDHAKAQGAILGKAMTGLKEGKGMVLVLVTLQ